MQTTLDTLFNKNTFIKPYFILNWRKKLSPEIAYFSDRKPLKYDFKCSIFVKSLYRTIIIYGCLEKFKSDIKKIKPKYKNIELLKSGLQKAIRRKNIKVAVLTARHLLDIDELAFLRRISIITVEDVEINDKLPIIIWLMIASSKNYKLEIYQKEWLLGYVYSITKHNYTDKIYNELKLDNYDFIKIIEKVKSEKHYDLITSLEIRYSYGGMKCDINLLKKLIWYWGIKSRTNQQFPIIPIYPIQYDTDDLEKNEWILETVDYHCFPKIIDWLKNKVEVNENIKEEIWDYRSKINKREKNLSIPSDWNEINKELNKIAHYVIFKFS